MPAATLLCIARDVAELNAIGAPLISVNELLRFPLDEMIILPEGQYPIRARHIQYFADRHFWPIERAHQGLRLPYPGERAAEEMPTAVRMSDLVKAKSDSAEYITLQAAKVAAATVAFSDLKQRRWVQVECMRKKPLQTIWRSRSEKTVENANNKVALSRGSIGHVIQRSALKFVFGPNMTLRSV